MKVNAGAKSYARAFFELALEQNQGDLLSQEIRDFSKLVHSSETLLSVLRAAQISSVQKRALLSQLASLGQLAPLSRNLILLLTEKKRLAWLEQISAYLQELTDERNQILRGSVITAEAMSVDQIKDLEKAFSKKFGKTVTLEARQDRQLLGGLVVQIRDLTFDGSLKSSLARLKSTLERQYV